MVRLVLLVVVPYPSHVPPLGTARPPSLGLSRARRRSVNRGGLEPPSSIARHRRSVSRLRAVVLVSTEYLHADILLSPAVVIVTASENHNPASIGPRAVGIRSNGRVAISVDSAAV